MSQHNVQFKGTILIDGKYGVEIDTSAGMNELHEIPMASYLAESISKPVHELLERYHAKNAPKKEPLPFNYLGQGLTREQAESLVTADTVHNAQAQGFDEMYEWFRWAGFESIDAWTADELQQALDEIIPENLTGKDFEEVGMKRGIAIESWKLKEAHERAEREALRKAKTEAPKPEQGGPEDAKAPEMPEEIRINLDGIMEMVGQILEGAMTQKK